MPKEVSTFRLPSEYERQAAEARRRRRMAEMLAQQAYQPQDVGVAPIPAAAPFVQGLQAFLEKRQLRKAEEAEEKARQADVESAAELMRQLRPQERSGAEEAVAQMAQSAQPGQLSADGTYTPSTITPGTAPIGMPYTQAAPTGEERDQLLYGAMATGSPRAAQLAQLLMSQKPKEEEFGTTPVKGKSGKYYLASKSGKLVETDVEVPVEEMTPYQKAQIEISKEELNLKRARGDAGERPKAPSGYRYDANGELEPIPGGPQDPNRPMAMPLNARTQIVSEQRKAREFATASQRTNKFIKDINEGKLPLFKGASILYATERALGGDELFDEENRPAYDRFYELERFVTEQVNDILSLAKGPQTDQDAIRARQQILDNPNNKQVVITALKTLDRLWKNEINLSESTIDDWYSQYNQPRKGQAAPSENVKTLNAEDQEALNWANSNPNDPRAAKIKSRLGVR